MKTLLFKEHRSRKETAFELGVRTVTVQNVLDKLPESRSPAWKVSSAVLEERRLHWSATVKQNADLSRNQLRKIASNVVYDTLRRYDREWLELHSPPKRKKGATKAYTNWPEKDRNLAAKIRGIAADILNTPGKPLRCSATLISRRLGVLEILYKRREDLLPVTRATIAAAAETVIDFAIRRVCWAVDAYTRDGVTFNEGQLKARAGLSYSMGHHPKVAAVINGLARDSGQFIPPQNSRRRSARSELKTGKIKRKQDGATAAISEELA